MTPEEYEANILEILRTCPGMTREKIAEWDKCGHSTTDEDIRKMQEGFEEADTRIFTASPECEGILKSDLPATQKISDLVDIYFRDNPEFEIVEEEFKHPSFFILHRKVRPWLFAQCDEENDYVQLWRLLLAAAKEWFPGKKNTKLGHLFCIRFEVEDCTWWNGWEPIQPVLQDYLRWCYGNYESLGMDCISTKKSSNNVGQETTMFTEKDAAVAFAKAWNRLDCAEFLQLLAEEAVYESQWVFSPLEGKEVIANYLAGKMQKVKVSGKKVRAELSTARCANEYGKACVLLKQGENRDTDSVMVFEVENDRIKRCDLCAPEFYDPEQTNVYPI